MSTLDTDTSGDTDAAIAAARAEARREVLIEVGQHLVSAEIKVEAARRGLDADPLLDGIDPTRFLTDDGVPDQRRIVDWLDRLVPPAPRRPSLTPQQMGQGSRPTDPGPRPVRDRSELRTMTPDEIAGAYQTGRLDGLLGRSATMH